MDAVVMAGGEGTRLNTSVEKPLFNVGNTPMIDSVLDALLGSQVKQIIVAVSPATPQTATHVSEHYGPGVRVVETDGDGYVEDLDDALAIADTPTLTVAADLPLLAAEPVDHVVDAAAAADSSLSVCVPTALKRQLGASVDTARDGLAPTGLNVVTETSDTMYVSYDARLAVNVNRRSDAQIAEALQWR